MPPSSHDAPPRPQCIAPSAKNPSLPIGDDLRRHLKRYRRERKLPVTHECLRQIAHTRMIVPNWQARWHAISARLMRKLAETAMENTPHTPAQCPLPAKTMRKTSVHPASVMHWERGHLAYDDCAK